MRFLTFLIHNKDKDKFLNYLNKYFVVFDK